MVGTARAYSKTLPATHGTLTHTVELPRFAYAGIRENEILGQIRFFCDIDRDGSAEEIATIPLQAKYGVEKYAPKQSLWERILAFFKALFGGKDED